MRSRAAVLLRAPGEWEVVEVEVDDPKEFEVLVRFEHAIGVCAPTPGGGFHRRSAQAEADAVPPTDVAGEYAGPAGPATWTVVFDRDGAPHTAMAALRTPSGARTLCRCAEPEAVRRLVDEEAAGAKADVGPDGTFTPR